MIPARIVEVTPRRRRRRRLTLPLVLAFMFGAPAAATGQPAAEDHGVADNAHGHHEDPSKTFNWYDGLPFSYRSKDKLGGPLGDGKLGDQPLAHGEAEEPMSAPFVLMVLNFILLLVILAKYGGPAARKVAETRSDQIKTALEEAAQLRDRARAKLEEYGKRLEAADAEMAKMIEAIRTDAEADRKRVIAAAEGQAAALKKDAEERIAAEISLARHALAQEVARAAAAAAETLIKAKATPGDQTRLVEGFITDLQAGTRQERT